MLENARKIAHPPELFSSMWAWCAFLPQERTRTLGLSVLWGTVAVSSKSPSGGIAGASSCRRQGRPVPSSPSSGALGGSGEETAAVVLSGGWTPSEHTSGDQPGSRDQGWPGRGMFK